MKNFKEAFPKNKRPEMTDLQTFFTKEAAELFGNLATWLMDTYRLSFANPIYTEKNGWVYKVGWSGVFLITGITVQENGFTILSEEVTDAASYQRMQEKVAEYYEANKEQFLNQIKEKNQKQAERSKKRIEREKIQKEGMASQIHPDKFNKFHWPQKLNVNSLRKLYHQDAKGIEDEDLADEIGLAIYVRCKLGKEDMEYMNQYALRCHGCNQILWGREDFRECSCGCQYSYRDYRRSYRSNNMPTGAASKVFEDYIQTWPQLNTYADKMRAIDKLLHEFHLNLNSGAVHRPVAMNFMDGTRERIEAVINELAYQ